MSKLTFRADDDLVDRLEAFDTSKSEVLREALREYIERHDAGSGGSAAVGERLDALLAERIDSRLDDRLGRAGGQDINLNITLTESSTRRTPATQPDDDRTTTRGNGTDDTEVHVRREQSHGGPDGKTDPGGAETADDEPRKTCTQCGDALSPSHVYCPNCGEKTAHRVFCDCGDELRSDWAFCPGCGRRTPAADVLDDS